MIRQVKYPIDQAIEARAQRIPLTTVNLFYNADKRVGIFALIGQSRGHVVM